jgi:hypothetical protein
MVGGRTSVPEWFPLIVAVHEVDIASFETKGAIVTVNAQLDAYHSKQRFVSLNLFACCFR